ncbi:hypothetical protein EJB05_14574, partial [Eragrostis curvula]
RIGTKRGLGARRSKGRVRSRVIHIVHVERTRSMDGFAVWPQNHGGDEDGVLTRVKANGRPVQVKGPDGLGPRRLDGDEVTRVEIETVSRFGLKTGGGRFPGLASKPVVGGFPVWASKPVVDGFSVWASKPTADGFPVWASKPAAADGCACGTIT